MAVEFKDYYKILGVSRKDSPDEIKRAYRKLARKHHPDLNKAAGSESAFKEINEAYEVLGDPEKRQKYDQFGNQWQQGDPVKPPPGWQEGFRPRSNGSQQQESFFWSSDGGDYSDFFEALFGTSFQNPSGSHRRHAQFSMNQQGNDHEAVLRITLDEAFRGATKSITLHTEDAISDQANVGANKRYDIKIPAGILPGQKIRLQGQGGQGAGGRGDLYLVVEIAPHPTFKLDGRNLTADLAVTPWEAALGTQIDLETLSGPITLKVPPGTQSGQRLRLAGKGMPNAKGRPGDLYVIVQIKVPKPLSQSERALFQELQKKSAFNPRA